MGCQQSVEANGNKQKMKELLQESFRRNRRTNGSGTVWINAGPTSSSSSNSSNGSGGSNKKRLRYAYMSQRGYYPDDLGKINQDAYSITGTLGGVDGDCLFAVYDGHGPQGHEFSTYAKNHLPELMAKCIEKKKKREELKDEEYEEASKEAHVECNNAMIESEVGMKYFCEMNVWLWTFLTILFSARTVAGI